MKLWIRISSWEKFLALSPSVCVVAGVSFLLYLAHVFSRTLSLSLSLSLFLSPSLTLVDAALQRLLCGVMSLSITIVSGHLTQAKANLTREWLGTDEANRTPVV